MDKKVWLSPRALKLHAVILVVVPAFLALCIWQVYRATGGNELSWAYVFEWPFFAAYAIYMWWRLLHAAPDATPPVAGSAANGTVPPPGETDAGNGSAGAASDDEDADLAAYNAYLAQLAERDRASGR
jgi:hypothetical protein